MRDYYLRFWGEEIGAGRFELPTVSRLECGVTRAAVIVLDGTASEFWKEVKWINSKDPLGVACPQNRTYHSNPMMTRSTDQSKTQLLLPKNLFPPVFTKVCPTHFLFVSFWHTSLHTMAVSLKLIVLLLNTVDNSVNVLWGSYKKNLLFQGIPRCSFPPDSFIFFLSLNLNFPTPGLTREQRQNAQAHQ